MKISKGLPTFSISVLSLIISCIQMVYLMSVHGFSHIDTKFILNTIFSVSLFLLAIVATIFIIILTVSLYILKKIGVLEGKFKDIVDSFNSNSFNLNKAFNIKNDTEKK